MPSPLGAIPGTSETLPDVGSALGGGGRGMPDPAGNTLAGSQAVQERIQGVTKILNKTAASIGDHAKGLGTLATQFPMASKQLKTAIDALEKAEKAIVTAITDVVREAQTSDQSAGPSITR